MDQRPFAARLAVAGFLSPELVAIILARRDSGIDHSDGREHDANGIIWPFSIAPFHVLLLPINYKDSRIRDATDSLYADLQEIGVDVLLDDRDERPGVKFKDADLVGVPLRVTIGPKALEKGRVELRRRREGQTEEVALGEVIKKTKSIISQPMQA